MRALRLPALERWLAAADVERKPGGATAWLAGRFGLPSPIPAAPIALAAERNGASAGAWLRADPVHVRIGQTSAVVETGARLGIDADEAAALTAALSVHFREDGLAFVAAAAERWYVRVPEGELPETPDAQDANDARALAALPVSHGRVNWRSALTEAQMLLAGHDVNTAREARGAPAINSLRLWGGGTWPVKVSRPYDAIRADDTFVRGLGIAGGVRLFDLPQGLEAMPRTTDTTLVFVDTLAAFAARGDTASWRDAAAALERGWFEPLRPALDRLAPVRLVLSGANGSLVATLKRPSLLARLRSVKPLAAYA